MPKFRLPHLKLGSTSYLLHDSYVPAVRFTAGLCDDVSLLLLETGENDCWLPSRQETAEMAKILDGEGASIHIHLPTDVFFDTEDDAQRMVRKVRKIAELTAPLAPHSFVLHVDFAALHKKDAADHPTMPAREQLLWTKEALREIAASLPSPDMLCLENLEGFPLSFLDPWLAESPYSRCLDIGHIWKDGGDPLSILSAWLPRVRVVHLHGLLPGSSPDRSRIDHKSLALMPDDALDDVMHALWAQQFNGTLVVEVFKTEDFLSSCQALQKSWERYCQ